MLRPFEPAAVIAKLIDNLGDAEATLGTQLRNSFAVPISSAAIRKRLKFLQPAKLPESLIEGRVRLGECSIALRYAGLSILKNSLFPNPLNTQRITAAIGSSPMNLG